MKHGQAQRINRKESGTLLRHSVSKSSDGLSQSLLKGESSTQCLLPMCLHISLGITNHGGASNVHELVTFDAAMVVWHLNTIIGESSITSTSARLRISVAG